MGEAFHTGCPTCHSQIDPKWEAKKRDIVSQGYQLEVMWSCEFHKIRKNVTIDSKLFPGIFKTNQTEESILKGILDDSLFGFIIADISSTEKSREAWREFPPVLRKITITKEHLPDHMIKLLESENPGIDKFERETLCQVFNGKSQVILSTLAKFYLQQGFKITNVTSFVQYIGYPALLPFANHVTEMRINAEKNGNPTKGATAKGTF